MKSLNFKLVALYVLSAFIIVTIVFAVTEYVNYNKSENSSKQLMEIGPGYINGATLGTIEEEARARGDDIHDLLSGFITGNSASGVLDNFRPIFTLAAPGGRSDSTTITLLPALFRAGDNYYRIDDATSEIGPVIISDNYFPSTISFFIDGPPWRRLYYSRVEDYNDLVIIGSLDIRFLPERNWLSRVALSYLLGIQNNWLD